MRVWSDADVDGQNCDDHACNDRYGPRLYVVFDAAKNPNGSHARSDLHAKLQSTGEHPQYSVLRAAHTLGRGTIAASHGLFG